MDIFLDNGYVVSMVTWPIVVIVAALLNMLISYVFSWQELVLCYIIGVLIGLFFFLGTHEASEVAPPETNPAVHFFLMASIGLPGLLNWIGIEAFQDREFLFWVAALSILIATVVSAALDRVAIQVVGHERRICSGLWSLLEVGIKAPFGLVTTGVGALIGFVGLFIACGHNKGAFGFIGGILYTQFGYGSATNYHATTFSSYVNIFKGPLASVASHELYHTRQYIYLQDWLGVFYFTFAALWGLISSAIAASDPLVDFEAGMAFDAEGEVGNPIEIGAHKLDW